MAGTESFPAIVVKRTSPEAATPLTARDSRRANEGRDASRLHADSAPRQGAGPSIVLYPAHESFEVPPLRECQADGVIFRLAKPANDACSNLGVERGIGHDLLEEIG